MRSGMFVRIAIILNEINDAPVVKSEAIITQDAETFVYTIVNGIAIRKDVTLGISYEGYTQILSGVEKEDQIIVLGQRSLKDQANIIVI